MASNLELVERFQDSSQAVVLRDILKGNGFTATIQGQQGLSGSGARMAGGFLVMVPRSEMHGVQNYLKRLEKEAWLHSEDETPAPETPKVAPGEMPACCPFCKSKNIAEIETPAIFRFVVTILLLGLPLLFPSPRTFQCKNCDQHWT